MQQNDVEKKRAHSAQEQAKTKEYFHFVCFDRGAHVKLKHRIKLARRIDRGTFFLHLFLSIYFDVHGVLNRIRVSVESNKIYSNELISKMEYSAIFNRSRFG